MSVLDTLNDILSYLPDVRLPKKLTTQRNPGQSNYIQVAPSADMSVFMRVAGLSGALAVSLAAYGSHVVRNDPTIEEKRKVSFETGSRYHFFHTIALLAAHRARFPYVTGCIMIGGMLLFCGPCYHYSITGSTSLTRFTPMGGVMFILGWLTFIL